MALRVENRRALIFNDRNISIVIDESRENVIAEAVTLLFLKPLQGALAQVGIFNICDQIIYYYRLVPQFQRLHLAKLGHGLAVRPDATRDRVLTDLVT